MSKVLEALKSRIYSDVYNILKSQGPVLGDDYKNDWICFGADINNGDGHISGMVRRMVGRMVEAYHSTVLEQAFWETTLGEVERKYIILGIKEDGSELELDIPDFDEMLGIIKAQVYEPIHTQADKDYLDFECEMGCDEDDYDEEDEEYEEEYNS